MKTAHGLLLAALSTCFISLDCPRAASLLAGWKAGNEAGDVPACLLDSRLTRAVLKRGPGLNWVNSPGYFDSCNWSTNPSFDLTSTDYLSFVIESPKLLCLDQVHLCLSHYGPVHLVGARQVQLRWGPDFANLVGTNNVTEVPQVLTFDLANTPAFTGTMELRLYGYDAVSDTEYAIMGLSDATELDVNGSPLAASVTGSFLCVNPTVRYVGTDVDTKAAWRSPEVLKPLDIDENSVYGSDGWVIYSFFATNYSPEYDPTNTRASLPAYIQSVGDPPRAWGGGDFANFGTIDDPLRPGSLHNCTHGFVLRGETLVLNIVCKSNAAFRLGVMVSNDVLGFEEDIEVAAGTSAKIRHTAEEGNNDLQYHFFNIPAGHTNVIVTIGNTSRDNPGLMGFTFDRDSASPIVPPVLNFTSSAGKLTLSWSAQGFKLQQTSDPMDPTTWTNVPAGEISPVTLNITAGHQFFRLKSQ